MNGMTLKKPVAISSWFAASKPLQKWERNVTKLTQGKRPTLLNSNSYAKKHHCLYSGYK